MLTVKDAVKTAKKMAEELYEGEKISHLGLEEVTFSEEKKEWLVTLGYQSFRTRKKQTTLGSYVPETEEETLREYKTLRIDAETGEFKGMKIRSL